MNKYKASLNDYVNGANKKPKKPKKTKKTKKTQDNVDNIFSVKIYAGDKFNPKIFDIISFDGDIKERFLIHSYNKKTRILRISRVGT